MFKRLSSAYIAETHSASAKFCLIFRFYFSMPYLLSRPIIKRPNRCESGSCSPTARRSLVSFRILAAYSRTLSWQQVATFKLLGGGVMLAAEFEGKSPAALPGCWTCVTPSDPQRKKGKKKRIRGNKCSHAQTLPLSAILYKKNNRRR